MWVKPKQKRWFSQAQRVGTGAARPLGAGGDLFLFSLRLCDCVFVRVCFVKGRWRGFVCASSPLGFFVAAAADLSTMIEHVTNLATGWYGKGSSGGQVVRSVDFDVKSVFDPGLVNRCSTETHGHRASESLSYSLVRSGCPSSSSADVHRALVRMPI